jgi:XRE family transcriptional regulator, regulator of sulfur utilization
MVMEIGKAIKELRKRKGYSQKEFALKVRLSTNALCQIEKGNVFAKKETLKAICENLEISVGYLILSCLDETDVSPEKLEVFSLLKNLLIEK